MDWKMKKQLLEKYWAGETSLEEEAWLRQQMPSFDELSTEENAYWQKLDQFESLSLDEAFSMEAIETASAKTAFKAQLPWYKNIRRLAAAVLVIGLLGTAINSIMNQEQQVIEIAAEQTPEEAFEIAKQSLMLISSKMNKGVDCTTSLEKFDQLKEKIKAPSVAVGAGIGASKKKKKQ